MNTSTLNETTIIEEPSTLMPLAFGHSVRIEKHAELLTVLSPHTGQSVTILFTQEGMTVQAQAPKMKMEAQEEIILKAPKIKLEAGKELKIQSQGNLVTEAKKDTLQETGGTFKSYAQEQKLTATLGNVELKANDDVKVDGERVLLNS